jgi:heptosyltransferase-2
MISVLGSNAKKTYPFDYMATILDAIVSSKPEAQILFNYIPKQEKDAKSIFDLCTQKTQDHIFFNVYGKSLREFLAITQHCNALIGNEGGANNMAKALNIPTFTIFSPYLNKQNWFGETETKKHIAIHLSDYLNYNKGDKENAKKNPETYYRKLKPKYFETQLKSFLTNLD